MEDRKRSLPVQSLGDEPSAKKPLLDSTRPDPKPGPDEPLTQEDVVLFQKEAIFRQMATYKREAALVQTRLTSVDAQYSALQQSFSALDLWWNKLLDQLSVGGDDGSTGDAVELPKSLLLTAVDEPSEFASLLTKKEQAVKTRLGPLLAHLSSGSLGPEISSLQQNIAALSTNLENSRAENQHLKLAKDALSTQLSEVSEKYLAAEKRLDRLLSPSLNRMGMSGRAVSQSNGVKEETPDAATTAAATTTATAGESDGSANESEAKVDPAELEALKSDLEESQAVVAKQKDHLAEQENQILGLKSQVNDLTLRMQDLTESDLQQSTAYRSLKAAAEESKHRAARAESQLEQLTNEKRNLISGREEFTMSIKKEYDHKKDELDRQVSKLEQDLTRIRGARDEILGELNIKKATESERYKGIEQLKDLLSIREGRIAALEEEVKRHRDEIESGQNDENGSTEDSADELKQQIEKLRRQNKSLASELPGMEKLYGQAHAKVTAKIYDLVEKEAKMNKLLVEKSKADEKYFSAMRAKDVLAMESNKIKSQLAKSTEVITQLKESERTKSHKITTLEKQVQGLHQSLLSYEREVQNFKAKCDDRDRRLDSASRHVSRARDELKTKDEHVSKEVEARRGLEIQIEKLKRQVETKRLTTVGGGSGSDAEEQIEALRSIALCSLCSKNWKDTAIKVCGHVFCNECAKDRLNARLRKCPMCNKQYSFNDLLPVHL